MYMLSENQAALSNSVGTISHLIRFWKSAKSKCDLRTSRGLEAGSCWHASSSRSPSCVARRLVHDFGGDQHAEGLRTAARLAVMVVECTTSFHGSFFSQASWSSVCRASRALSQSKKRKLRSPRLKATAVASLLGTKQKSVVKFDSRSTAHGFRWRYTQPLPGRQETKIAL